MLFNFFCFCFHDKPGPPDACFQNDRDRLREFIINWFQISAKKQEWYR